MLQSDAPAAASDDKARRSPRSGLGPLLEGAFGFATAAILLLGFLGLTRLNNVDEGDLRPFGGDALDHIPIKVGTILLGQIFLVAPALFLLARIVLRHAGDLVDRTAAAIRRRPGVTVAVLAVVALAVTALLSWIVIQHAVLTDDEMTQLFQARLLEHGRLVTRVPEPRAFFDQPRLAYLPGSHWTGIFPWGHAALLALGDLVGFPQLWPHLSAPLTVVLTYLLCREASPDETDASVALGAALLVATSPFLLLTAGTLHNATTSVVMVTLGAYLLARHRRRGGLAPAILAGAAFGFDLHARPLNAMVAGGVALLLTAVIERRERKSPRELILGFALGCAPWLALHGALNWIICDTPFRPPITRGNERPIFGLGNLAFGAYHTPWKSLGQVVTNAFELVVWASGSVLTALAFVVGAVGAGRGTGRRADWLWLVIPGALLAGYYFFFRTPPIDTGPTYFLDAAPFLAIFVARVLAGAPAAVARLAARALAPDEETNVRRAALAIPTLALLAGLGTFWPQHLHGISRSTDTVLAPYRAVEDSGIHRAIVFWHGSPARRSDVTQPPLPAADLDDEDILYARDRRENAELGALYPDRKLYTLRYERGQAVVRPWQPPAP